jgi:tRNA (mo5U34)-methyltransferase
MELDALKREVATIDWWHQIHLGNGVVTPGKINPAETLKRIRMPDDLCGKTVLDIGASDGFYSFEAERRGAKRVVATGLWGKGYRSKAGFELARKALRSRVEDVEINLFDMSAENVGIFDVVLFLGVLYHLRHPLLGLERVYSVTGDQLILESYVDMVGTREPVMRFYPGRELNNDSTNWWGPNPAAVEDMLRSVGFQNVVLVSAPDFDDSRSAQFRRMLRVVFNRPLPGAVFQGRAVFHAWR